MSVYSRSMSGVGVAIARDEGDQVELIEVGGREAWGSYALTGTSIVGEAQIKLWIEYQLGKRITHPSNIPLIDALGSRSALEDTAGPPDLRLILCLDWRSVHSVLLLIVIFAFSETVCLSIARVRSLTLAVVRLDGLCLRLAGLGGPARSDQRGRRYGVRTRDLDVRNKRRSSFLGCDCKSR